MKTSIYSKRISLVLSANVKFSILHRI